MAKELKDSSVNHFPSDKTPSNLKELGEFIVAKETANRVTFQANSWSPVDSIYVNSNWLKDIKRDGKPIDMTRIRVHIEVL